MLMSLWKHFRLRTGSVDVISRMSHLFDLLKISRIVSCILIPAPIFRPHSGHGHVHIHESMGGMLLIQVPHVCLHASLYLQFIDCIINICLLICVYVGVRSSNLLIGGEAASVSMNRKVDRQPVHFRASGTLPRAQLLSSHRWNDEGQTWMGWHGECQRIFVWATQFVLFSGPHLHWNMEGIPRWEGIRSRSTGTCALDYAACFFLAHLSGPTVALAETSGLSCSLERRPVSTAYASRTSRNSGDSRPPGTGKAAPSKWEKRCEKRPVL